MKIKKCPFCKRKDDIKKEIIQIEDKSYSYVHFCTLGAKTRLCISLNGETPEDIIKKWNKRGEK